MPNWVNATDLNLWANRIESQSELPRLIRRLVHDTCKEVVRIEFPSGESVQMGGYDGLLEVLDQNELVPKGKSAWELGVQKDIKHKADSDYKKRTANPKGEKLDEMTFIFVTPRRWGAKAKWVKAKNAEGKWAEVRAYDADDLEQWLEIALSVQAWFARFIGKQPEDVEDLWYFWEKWHDSTSPPMAALISLAGRKEATKKLIDWLSIEPSSLTVQGESKEEAIAFIAAALQELPQDQQEYWFSRTLIVYSSQAWRQVTASREKLLLVPALNHPEGVGNALRGGHHVLIPINRETTPSKGALLLPRSSKQDFEQALVSTGLTLAQATSLTASTRRSLLVLRRKNAPSPEVHHPKWAEPSFSHQFITILLAGAWSESNDEDKNAIEGLAGRSYSLVAEEMLRWQHESDPPVRQISEVWQLISREDSWMLLARYLTEADLEAFERVTLSVLSIPDSRYEVPPDERWIAEMFPKHSPNSSWFKSSLVNTLVLLGARSEDLNSPIAEFANEKLKVIVSHLLNPNASWQRWATLAQHMPLLAEAHPEAFLRAVEETLLSNESVLVKLFAEEQLRGSSPHMSLLWALEALAWLSTNLKRVVLVLAKLAVLDPGGKTYNRPINSLIEIFLPWHPQTTATLDIRLQALSTIVEREPSIAWKLLIGLLPERGGGSSSGTYRPQWRDWFSENAVSVSITDYHRNVEVVSDLLISLLGNDIKQWEDLLPKIDVLPPNQIEKVLEALSRFVNIQPLYAEERTKICSLLGNQINDHLSFPNTSWSLPSEEVQKLEYAYRKILVRGTMEECLRLFKPAEEIPELAGIREWNDQQQQIAKMRSEALLSLFDDKGLTGVLELASRISQPDMPGEIIGQLEIAAQLEDQVFNACIICSQHPNEQFLRGFVRSRFSLGRWEWAGRTLLLHTEWTSRQIAQFIIWLRFGKDAWLLLAKFSEEIEREYWRLVEFRWPDNLIDCEYAISQFLKFERPFDALVVAFSYINNKKPNESLLPELLYKVLVQALDFWTTNDQQQRESSNIQYHIVRIFNALDAFKESFLLQIEELEWAYLPILKSSEQKILKLHLRLEQDPSYFANLISWIFDNEYELEANPRDIKARQERSRLLLDSWRILPGLSSDKTIEESLFKSWAFKARELCTERKLRDFGDEELGKMFAILPNDQNGVWPHIALRDLIEEFESKSFEKGIEYVRIYGRNTHFRLVDRGGTSELRLAQEYKNYAETLKLNWPRTSAMLERIAQAYGKSSSFWEAHFELQDY
jgi:hypothetical protein